MSEYFYTYSLASDFGGPTGLSARQLHTEISTDVGITGANLLRIDTGGDDVDTVFNASLSAGEVTTLDGVISSHVPDNSPKREISFNSTPHKNSTNTTTYAKLGRIKYDGSDNVGAINYIDVVGYKDSSVTTYDVRIYDCTNGNVVCEGTGFTNNDPSVKDLGTVSNVPTSSAVLEVQAKRNGGSGNNKNVYVDQVIVYHNN